MSENERTIDIHTITEANESGGSRARRVLLLPLGRARAESSPEDKALATTLFQEGRALMAAQKLDEACPKLRRASGWIRAAGRC